ncbi:hypothetical protein ISF_04310 [Cordyceps fumosorosea ARSEF 2679]|uniref:Lysozyme-like domain protein n=1 Tax=Cordyceps fumosorosea (strain ARSEF 2679) TaxID=1081104 RepID=A0A162MPI2_CORFA|nr:hypothetical protein ISF_04310 [Cordyceps fumosorosea ARSEF 2679]OAA64900.1 hypothetical protein ISF_04310 [Cordyceps fumosorosea ARSEF 2679]
MKTSTPVALLSLISGIAALPSLRSVHVRDCKAGHLVCQGQALFGICNLNSKAIFMSVAEGTKCVCSGSDCTIVAAAGPAQASQGPAPTSQPAAAPTSQSAAAPTSQSAAAPTSQPAAAPTSQAAPPATQPSSTAAAPPAQSSAPPAPSSAPGGVFQETSISTPPAATQPAATASQPATPAGTAGVDIGLGKGYLKVFLGTGAASSGWPEEDQWASFDSLWAANEANVLPIGCGAFGQANDSPQEIADIKAAILSVAASSGVDSRFILAIVMQESNGCVRVPTTNGGVRNPGLMQSHDGSHTCDGVNPCPKETILGMIQDGVEGTPAGDGLKQLLAKAGGTGAQTYYKAARMYNSGSIDGSGLLEGGGATHCYASDVANRLIGWSEGVGGCRL